MDLKCEFPFSSYLEETPCFKRLFILIQNEKMPSDSPAISRALGYRFPLFLGISRFHRALQASESPAVPELGSGAVPISSLSGFPWALLSPEQATRTGKVEGEGGRGRKQLPRQKENPRNPRAEATVPLKKEEGVGCPTNVLAYSIISQIANEALLVPGTGRDSENTQMLRALMRFLCYQGYGGWHELGSRRPHTGEPARRRQGELRVNTYGEKEGR